MTDVSCLLNSLGLDSEMAVLCQPCNPGVLSFIGLKQFFFKVAFMVHDKHDESVMSIDVPCILKVAYLTNSQLCGKLLISLGGRKECEVDANESRLKVLTVRWKVFQTRRGRFFFGMSTLKSPSCMYSSFLVLLMLNMTYIKLQRNIAGYVTISAVCNGGLSVVQVTYHDPIPLR